MPELQAVGQYVGDQSSFIHRFHYDVDTQIFSVWFQRDPHKQYQYRANDGIFAGFLSRALALRSWGGAYNAVIKHLPLVREVDEVKEVAEDVLDNFDNLTPAQQNELLRELKRYQDLLTYR